MNNLFSNLKEKESTILGIAVIGVDLYLFATAKIDATAFGGVLTTGLALLGLSFKNQK